MPEEIAAFAAFMQEHRRCGAIDGGVDGQHAWLTCDRGARIIRPLVEPPATRTP
jgi:hypothetical protein